MNTENTFRFEFDCINLSENTANRVNSQGYIVEIFHRDGEPANANRIWISRENLKIEILPSKGFSIGEFSIGGKPVFWDPPVGLPDPDKLNFDTSDIYIYGEQVRGFEFLKTFVGGIEFMGLKNWGMPYPDPVTGDTLPLHGEAGNIPVEKVEFISNDRGLIARGSFLYRTFEGEEGERWHKRGQELYRVTRTLILDNDISGMSLSDSIENVSSGPLVPDWGYHVTFRPKPGSKLHIPSKHLEERSGGEVPAGHDTWMPAADEKIRTEIGIIHKQLKPTVLAGIPSARILKEYPDGRAFELNVPLSPYFQTWSSCGGKDTDEFTFKDGSRLFTSSWNGFGIEFGSSALDHNGNNDESVDYKKTLMPGESLGIVISVEQLNSSSAGKLKAEMQEYNTGRR